MSIIFFLAHSYSAEKIKSWQKERPCYVIAFVSDDGMSKGVSAKSCLIAIEGKLHNSIMQQQNWGRLCCWAALFFHPCGSKPYMIYQAVFCAKKMVFCLLVPENCMFENCYVSLAGFDTQIVGFFILFFSTLHPNFNKGDLTKFSVMSLFCSNVIVNHGENLPLQPTH